MSGFDNDVCYFNNISIGQTQPVSAQMILDGQLLIGDTAGNPQISTITAGAGIVVVNGAGSITISATAMTMAWLDLGVPGALALSTGYFITGAGAYTLPVGVANGDTVEIVDEVGGGVIVTAPGAQIIQIQNVASSAGGTATSTLKGDALRLKFRLADVTWYQCPGAGGNWNLA